MQNLFSNTAGVIILGLVSFFCCPLLGIVLGGVGVASCYGDAKRNALIVLVVALVALVINVLLYSTGVIKIPVAQ